MDLMSKQPALRSRTMPPLLRRRVGPVENAHLHLYGCLTRVIGERKIGLMRSMYRNSKSHMAARAPHLHGEYIDGENTQRMLSFIPRFPALPEGELTWALNKVGLLI